MATLRPTHPRTSSSSTLKHKHFRPASGASQAMTERGNVVEEESLPLPPILRLPEELRIAIWNVCLTADNPIQWPDEHLNTALTPALLRVCKSVNREATPILYRTNTLACQHPSDCNMFGWAHSPDHAKTINSIALHIRDQDTRLWAAYLGSSNIHRSLIHDFPKLHTLNITFRSRYWGNMDGSPLDKFSNWLRDPRLKEMCEILKEATSGDTKIRILAVHRVPVQDMRQLMLSPIREQLSLNRDNSEARTNYMRMARADVALALTPLNALPA